MPAPRTDDATVVGFWITGGVNVSILSTRRMRSLAPWLKARQLNQLAVALNITEPEAETAEEGASEGAKPQQRVSKPVAVGEQPLRSEEHTSELQSLMRISYAVFCLKKKKKNNIP